MPTRRQILRSALLGAALLGLALPALAQGSRVKIGVLSDMSGLFSDFGGPGSVVAAKMAVEDFGGNLLGKPVEVVSADHQNKPDVGTGIVRGWYDNEGVDIVVDVLNSVSRCRSRHCNRTKTRSLFSRDSTTGT